MSNFLVLFYEKFLGLFNQDYYLIFEALKEYNGYLYMFLSFTIIPLLIFILFYLLYKNPYAKLLHWVITLVFSAVATGIVAWWIANNQIFNSYSPDLIEALSDPELHYEEYAKGLCRQYAIYLFVLSLIMGFIYSLIIKRFSKNQIHLPF